MSQALISRTLFFAIFLTKEISTNKNRDFVFLCENNFLNCISDIYMFFDWLDLLRLSRPEHLAMVVERPRSFSSGIRYFYLENNGY